MEHEGIFHVVMLSESHIKRKTIHTYIYKYFHLFIVNYLGEIKDLLGTKFFSEIEKYIKMKIVVNL